MKPHPTQYKRSKREVFFSKILKNLAATSKQDRLEILNQGCKSLHLNNPTPTQPRYFRGFPHNHPTLPKKIRDGFETTPEQKFYQFNNDL